jgi:dTDP-4-dehydrorhamnose 3,5-epimerase
MDKMTESLPIDGAKAIVKKVIRDERGMVAHMMRSDSPEFSGFGEIYFSFVNPGIVKGWKLHEKVGQNLTVPVGSILFTLYDPRPEASSKGKYFSIKLSLDDHRLLQIPAGVWYAFENLSDYQSMIVNCVDTPHDPSESKTMPINASELPDNPYSVMPKHNK